MRVNRLLAATALTFGMCSLSYAAPALPKLDGTSVGQLDTTEVACFHNSRKSYVSGYGVVWHHYNKYCHLVIDEDTDDDDDDDDGGDYGNHHHRHHQQHFAHDYDPYPGHGGCYMAGSPPLTFEYCP